jgi:hypothetical protein
VYEALAPRLLGVVNLDSYPPRTVPAPTADTPALAQAEQREALEDLRAWFNDWSTTLRPLFGTRAQITLGLSVLKRAPKSDEDGAGEDEPEGGETLPTEG